MLPDTGQTKCYSNEQTGDIPCPLPDENFYGQDAQYTRARSYTDLGNGIVRDNVTGLEWQQTAPLAAMYDEQRALDYCNNLTLAGHSDWRLPTLKELLTLIDSGPDGTAINTTFFPDTGVESGSPYRTSTIYLPNTSYTWAVHFATGNIQHNSLYWGSYVRAVRGNSLPANNFINNADGTVTDTSTGLMWQQLSVPDTYTWQEALEYCENLNLAGHSDWRLPDRNELLSIVDFNQYQPAINTTFFPEPLGSFYWSSTSNPAIESFAPCIYISDSGSIGQCYKENTASVRAVRSWECIDDIDCGENYECANGVCMFLCTTDDDCPEEGFCDTDTNMCVECLNDTDCDDGGFCNGQETCIDNVCVPDSSPCSEGQVCDEASDQCVEECLADSNYDYTISEGEVTITGYNGPGGDIVIPAKIECLPVVKINGSAFYGDTSLTSVTFPEGIITIGWSAFRECSNVTSVTIPDSTINIWGLAFRDCDKLTSVTIPASVINMGPGVFSSCGSLTDIQVDAGNASYASVDGILYTIDMTKLMQYPGGKPGASHTIPDTITEIDGFAFSGCSNLESVTIPSSISSIGEWVFNSCSKLSSATIPDSVTSIGSNAFSQCSSLTTIVIPANVTSIASKAFNSCAALESAFFLGDAPSMEDAVFSQFSGFSICYTPEATGFTTPTWEGYPASACACSDIDDCDIGYACVDGICVEDQPPIFLSEPRWVGGVWPVLSTDPANPHTATSELRSFLCL